ncbi:MAG: ATP-dependent protease ATPase subunit HslU [Cyclobacteriaceae bacterium]|nr:ATP-dependent protease ATPase subunit HslU [Cyclobacteriaceae bacterium]
MESKDLTPSQIVAELDKYIIGQHEAKRNVAIALRNRWRRMNVPGDMRQEIMPNNILMIGATGVGKTEIARRLARIADAPFVKVEASKFTEVGYVGRDVESMVRDLVEQSVNLVRSKKKEEVSERAAAVVEDLILDALIPPMKTGPARTTGFPTSGEQVPEGDSELNERTRHHFREKIRSGEMDERKIEIDIRQSSGGNVGMIGAGMMDEVSMMNLQEMLNGMMPKKSRKRRVSIAEARKILMEEEVSRLIDMDEVKEEAIRRAENAGIIFIDEIDKVASGNRKGGGGPDVSREGVQRDLLPIVEGSTVNTKHGVIRTDHVLFIAAGAFHMSKPSDLIPELQGRFPIRVELNNLVYEDFVRILTDPKNALVKQYQALFESEGVTAVFSPESIEELARMAVTINTEVENIGARRLQTVMSRLLNEFLFDVPDRIPSGSRIEITREMVAEKLGGLSKNRDLSEYIL